MTKICEVRVTDDPPPFADAAAPLTLLRRWPPRLSAILLTIATLACLLPFSNKAFHIDDPLFVWTAQHIARHPLDPYGFRVVWYATEASIADVTKNPPLASYYAALAGSLFGWSERSLHLAFLLPALAAILGTYWLAQRFTQFPLLAATATLFAPGFLVSATTVMCDVLMLALWLFAVLFWLQGAESGKHLHLLAAALLISACALTKYFGAALIPLLLVYSLVKKRRLDASAAYLCIPVLLLTLYQFWTRGLYGRGLLSDAAQYAGLHNRGHELPLLAKAAVGLAFTGGCALPALLFVPLLWSRRWLFAALAVCAAIGLAVAGTHPWFEAPLASAHWKQISVEMALLSVGGLATLALAFPSRFKRMDAGSLLLALWVVGTFLFAAFVNWTVNARSVLPLLPAIGILVARRVESIGIPPRLGLRIAVTAVLGVSAFISLWITAADAGLANAGRAAATLLHAQTQSAGVPVYFQGHWGFEYYMQQFGAQPADLRKSPFHAGDLMVIPENTTNSFGPPPGYRLAGKIFALPLGQRVATMSQPLGAGFYASVWGPLPFAFGKVPLERYLVARLAPLQN